MHIVYSGEEPPESFSRSIFLAGPTPRPDKPVLSWRPQALSILKAKGYDGVVFVPEDRSGVFREFFDDASQVDWEHRSMNMSDCVMFWVYRDLETLPGFTTNIEFGLTSHLGKSVFGAPPSNESPKNNYLRICAEKFHIPQAQTLEQTIDFALRMAGPPALRTGGEREVPLRIWHLAAFQSWYQSHKNVGNRLEGCELQWIAKVRNKPWATFAFAIQPRVYIAAEDRVKVNDPVVSRLDIATVVLYRPGGNPLSTRVVLVKEFRTAGSTDDGFIWELPGGSSPTITDPLAVAVEEVFEEVNLRIPTERFKGHGARQLAGTLSAHKAHLFSVQLTANELEHLVSQKDIPHGNGLDDPTGERLYIEVLTLAEIQERGLCDWGNLGMIKSVLHS